MTKWDITPAGVRVVTSLTGEAVDGMNGHAQAYLKAAESAADSSGTISEPTCGVPPTGAVSAALGVFAQETSNDIRFIGLRAARSILGAQAATGAYILGDLDMAAQAQSAALQTPDPDGPSVGGRRDR
ncbi:hypothetical protein H8N00_00250 [Streptomyces sp. AC563]|uniref:DUF6507 family protein n=1 Tax=Streptomyces buecherae TaxID=2763006 RepID=UPI00164E2B25|nr:DUF6507 family protein [Streptomyces buecherae]MBC3987368.1 hypothetical protein [Streptomyces buecherae]